MENTRIESERQEIPQSIFPCIYKGKLSHIPGKADQFVPGQLFSVFPSRSQVQESWTYV